MRFLSAGRASLFCVVLAMGAAAVAAEPTLNQVYEAVQAGRLNQAQGMMTEVLRNHPNSAKAHYVEAEILTKAGRYGEARAELNRAEELAPGLPFASATSVQELRGLIASEGLRQAPNAASAPPAIAPAAHESSFPWGLLVIVLAGGLVIYAIVRARRNTAVAPYGGAAGGTAASSATPSAAPMAPMGAGMGGGMGSGIVGGLVTGAALGAGVVAGEALAHDLMGGHGSSRDLPRSDAPAPVADNDLGGQDFGVNDSGSWDDGGGGLGGDGGGSDWS
ncbi:MAG TPA: tetratricopeptide repeat protein [Burkholderiaceae bacterium]|nr:tetratricopeptide repeat protein [Burkholderiaceae bacterium]